MAYIRCTEEIHRKLKIAASTRGTSMQDLAEAWIGFGLKGGECTKAQSEEEKGQEKTGQPSTTDSTVTIPTKDHGIGTSQSTSSLYYRDQPDRNIEDLLLAARRLLMHPIAGPALSMDIAAFDLLARQTQGQQTSSAATPSDLPRLTPEEERRQFEEIKARHKARGSKRISGTPDRDEPGSQGTD